MARKDPWARGYDAGARYSRKGYGGALDRDGNSLTIRENRIYAVAWEEGRRAGLRDARRRKRGS